MNQRHTINLLQRDANASPPAGKPSLQSWVGFAIIALIIMYATLDLALSTNPLETAEAQAPASVVKSPQGLAEYSKSHAMYSSLKKAEGWIPLDLLCSELCLAWAGEASLQEFKYSVAESSIQIAGSCADLDRVPELMLFFNRYPWLGEPVPIRILQNEDKNAALFTLKMAVLSPFRLEPAP